MNSCHELDCVLFEAASLTEAHLGSSTMIVWIDLPAKLKTSLHQPHTHWQACIDVMMRICCSGMIAHPEHKGTGL